MLLLTESVSYVSISVIVGKSHFNGEKMYKNVLLTDHEIGLLKSLVIEYLSTKKTTEDRNLTIILNRLREKSFTKTTNQLMNYS